MLLFQASWLNWRTGFEAVQLPKTFVPLKWSRGLVCCFRFSLLTLRLLAVDAAFTPPLSQQQLLLQLLVSMS